MLEYLKPAVTLGQKSLAHLVCVGEGEKFPDADEEAAWLTGLASMGGWGSPHIG